MYESRWLQHIQKEGQRVTCQGFLSQMEAKFSSAREIQIRQKWEALKCNHNGEITVADLQKFELEFRQLRKELPTISDEEVQRHVMKRLPQHIVNWVADEEIRLKSEHPGLCGHSRRNEVMKKWWPVLKICLE